MQNNGYIVLSDHNVPMRLIVKSPPFLTAACPGIFSPGQVSLQMHNCSKSISSSHRHLIFWFMCKLQNCSLILPLLCMTSVILLLIKKCGKKPSRKFEHICNFQSLLCVLYFTHGDSTECTRLLQI